MAGVSVLVASAAILAPDTRSPGALILGVMLVLGTTLGTGMSRNETVPVRPGRAPGLRVPGSYTVQMALDDWFAEGLSGRSARTVKL